MMVCRRAKAQPYRKSGHYSSRSTWTKNDLIAFRTFLTMVMRPAVPPQGREQFLKLHPVCDACKNEGCALSSDPFGVRCMQCVQKRKRCPRQVQFWVLSVAELMEKPTAVVAEMYELFGVQVLPRYGYRGSRTFNAVVCKEEDNDIEGDSAIERSTSSESESEEEDPRFELSSMFTKKENEIRGLNKASIPFGASIFEPGLTIRDRKRPREEAETWSAHRPVKARQNKDKLSAMYPLIARFAICRDKIRAAGRPFTKDERAKRLLTALEELDMIGEGFSEVLGDVGMVESL